MSVEVLQPNGVTDVHMNGAAENGTPTPVTAPSKYIAGLIYPPPDIRSKFLSYVAG